MKISKTILAGAALLLLAVVVWQLARVRRPAHELVLSGTIEADEIHVGSKLGGRVTRVAVREGEEVKKGQILLTFDQDEIKAEQEGAEAALASAEAELAKAIRGARPEELAAARAEAEAARLSLAMAKHGPRLQEIEIARADFSSADSDYRLAQVEQDRAESLYRQGFVSRQQLDGTRAAFLRARARREAALKKLDLLKAGTRREEVGRAESQYREALAKKELVERGSRSEDIAAARAQVERAQAALDAVKVKLREAEVRSPAQAVVEVLRVRPGDLLPPGAPVAALVEATRLWVRVYVPEPELGHVRPGQRVSVRIDTFPGRNFSGWVSHVASQGEFTPRNVQTREERSHLVFAARVRLENSEGKLRPGMAADVILPR